jgi:CP family cyanate transporter-like MFS transporter
MQQEVNRRMPRTIVGVASLMAFATWAPAFCVPPMEHILKEELLITHTQTILLFTIPTLMLVVLGIPGGFLADRIGVRKAAGIGIIIIAVGTMLRGTATSASSLIAFTFIYGAGVGLTAPTLPKLIGGWVSREKASMAIGIYISVMFIGNAMAMAMTMPLIFPIINTFQGVFFIWSIPPIVSAISWWILVREPPHDNIPDESVSRGNISFHQILRNKNLWLLAILFLLFIFFLDGWIGWAPALMMLKGATESIAGLIASICLWVGIPTSFFIPRFSYKLGLRKPFLWIPAITLALAAWGAIYISIPLIWPFMILLGVALNAFIPIILALPIEMVSKKEVGTATGLVLSVGNIGGVIGPLVGGRIFDLTGSLDSFLLVLIGISIAATAIAFRLPETGPRARKLLS